MAARAFDGLGTTQEERDPGEMASMLDCHKIWDKLSSRADFKDGTIDIDNLCSELRTKARCSETGVVVDHKDVEEALRKLDEPENGMSDGKAGAIRKTRSQDNRARRRKRSPRNEVSRSLQKKQSSWRRIAMASDSSEDDLTTSDSQGSQVEVSDFRPSREHRGMSHGSIDQPRRSNTTSSKLKYTVSEDTTKDEDTRCRAQFQALGCRTVARATCQF
ncbi:hypothetical protein NX059_001903 [Plenodomus lindquistii]|nr:hypothetical protein NX059_001903 [Plenodomus lindquistii]